MVHVENALTGTQNTGECGIAIYSDISVPYFIPNNQFFQLVVLNACSEEIMTLSAVSLFG